MRQCIITIIVMLQMTFPLYADSIPEQPSGRGSVCYLPKMDVSPIPSNDETANLTLAVNAINNILTYASFIVGLLTLVTIIAGYFGYKRLKDEVDKKVVEIDEKTSEIENFKQQLANAQQMLKVQDMYIDYANGYLFQTTEHLVNQIADDATALSIFRQMNHKYHVANLYSAKQENRFAALAYLRNNGDMSDIEHLQHISTTDPIERYRLLATEISGIIKYKTENEKNPNH